MKRKTEADLCMEHVLDELFAGPFGEIIPRAWITEYDFSEDRDFRFDYCLPAPDLMLAIEIEGGMWIREGGRHNRPGGFVRDLEKYNLAACLGFSLLRFTPQQVLDGTAKEVIKRWLEAHK